MNAIKIILLAAFYALALRATAQDTNSLKTQIGSFEARTGILIIKGFGQVGSISLGSAELALRCKETSELGSGEKLYGLAFVLEGNTPFPERALIDDDEVDALLDALNNIIKIDNDVTSLPAYEATYTTKAGFRIIAHSDRREGGIHSYVQLGDYPRFELTSIQMTQLYNLLALGQKNLAKLKADK